MMRGFLPLRSLLLLTFVLANVLHLIQCSDQKLKLGATSASLGNVVRPKGIVGHLISFPFRSTANGLDSSKVIRHQSKSSNRKTKVVPQKLAETHLSPLEALVQGMKSTQREVHSSLRKISSAEDSYERMGIVFDMITQNKVAMALTAVGTISLVRKILPVNPQK